MKSKNWTKSKTGLGLEFIYKINADTNRPTIAVLGKLSPKDEDIALKTATKYYNEHILPTLKN